MDRKMNDKMKYKMSEEMHRKTADDQKNGQKYNRPEIKICGDDAVIVEFGDGIHPDINAEVQKFMRILEEMQADYIVEMVPTYRSLFIQYNPLLISYRELCERIQEKMEGGTVVRKERGKAAKRSVKNAWFVSGNNGEERVETTVSTIPAGEYGDYVRLIEVPTLYGGEHGPDLSFVAETNTLSSVDVVKIHSGRDYLVYMLGFMPGFPYLGGLDERIHTPRLSNPRTRIPAGSVGIAGEQTGIYPSASPGGWQLIGRTPLRLYDPDSENPVFISSGDYIRYIPIGISEFSRMEKIKNLKPRIRLVHRSEIRSDVEVEIEQDDLGEFGSEYRSREGDDGSLQLSDDHHVIPAESAETCVRVKVLSPGALTTVQDLGRTGYQKYGIPVSGAMDQLACRLANILVGNREEEAVLEATYMGPELLFEGQAAIAVTGGGFKPRLNGADVPMYRRIFVNKGDVLSLGSSTDGIRAYIGISGSLSVPLVSGSKSTHLKSQFGGLEGRKLQRDDILEFICPREGVEREPFSEKYGGKCGMNSQDDFRAGGRQEDAMADILQELAETIAGGFLGGGKGKSADGVQKIHVLLGPQQEYFTEKGIRTFFSEDGYEITAESDRMGMKLSGKKIEHARSADIVSDATVIGAVQVPANGEPIVLLADRQTTGGYSKIGVVIKEDVYRLAQMPPGTRVRFCIIGIEEAQARYRRMYEGLDDLKRTIRRMEKGDV